MGFYGVRSVVPLLVVLEYQFLLHPVRLSAE